MATLKTKTKVAGGAVGVISAIVIAVLGVEGGYVNDPRDPGGETNHGVTKKVAVENGYTAPMIQMPQEVAIEIYTKQFAEKPGFAPFADLSPAVAHKLIDAGANTGTGRPSVWLQTALNRLNRGGRDYPTIQVDGKVGPGTVSAYRGLVKVRGKVKACELVIKAMDAQQGSYYLSLTHLPDFTVGWLDHRIGNVPLSRCKE